MRSAIVLFLAFLAGPVLAQDDLPSRWVGQLQTTALYRFDVLVGEEGRVSDDPDDMKYYVRTVRVIDRARNAPVQELVVDSGVPFAGPPERLLRVTDANFDGLPDFYVPTFDGGSGPNNNYAFFLFNKARQAFVMHEGLSQLPAPTVNIDRTISSGSRGGCCMHGSETYRFVGNKLQLIGSLTEIYTPDNKHKTTACKRVNTKMRCKTTTKRMPRAPG